MRLAIVAVGRMKTGPEAALVEAYAARAGAAGRGMGLGPVRIAELDDRKAKGAADEGRRLLALAAPGAALIALDERGEALTSPAFARMIAGLRDAGRPEAAFLIGGADGHGPELRAGADQVISFGAMVWPHLLVRAMLAEQLFRAVSILAGHPYHRV